MSGPKTPDAFAAICADVAALLTHGRYHCSAIFTRSCPGHEEGEWDCRGQRVPYCVPCSYRWAFNASTERTKLGSSRGTKGSVSDPVASIATELRPDERMGIDPDTGKDEHPGRKAQLRAALRNASNDVQLVQGLQKRITAALNSSDVGHDAAEKFPEDSKPGKAKTQEGTDDAMAALHAAKRRREDRGEGWGIG